MNISHHIVRNENIKAIKTLHAAGIDHKVIALFMSSEGVKLETIDINIILNTYGALADKKISAKKFRRLFKQNFWCRRMNLCLTLPHIDSIYLTINNIILFKVC